MESLQTNPLILFSLIKSRIDFNPEDWMPFDFNETTFGWHNGLLEVEFHSSCVIMHGPKFGDLTPWVKEEIHRGYTMGFPRAKLIFEAQAVLMKFLRQMTELIGHNSPDGVETSEKWSGTLRHGLAQSSFSNWSHHALRPFSAPPLLDLDKLLCQVKARVEATGDHLWLLQTEPSYLKHHIRSIRQSEPFHICLKSNSIKLLIHEIILDVTIHWSWQWLLDELNHAKALYIKHQDSIRPNTPIPRDYDLSLAAIESILLDMQYRRIGQLQALIPQRPAFRHLHEFQYKNEDPECMLIRKREGIDPYCMDTNDIESLYCCLMQMLGDPACRMRVPIPTLFVYLDAHLANSPLEECSKLDPILYAKLSDYAAIHDIFTRLRFNPPRATWICVCDPRKHDSRGIQRYFTTRKENIGVDLAMTRLLEEFIQTPLPSGGKNGNWLHSFSDVHLKLQKFWRGIHDRFEVSLKGTDLSLEDRKLDLKALKHWNNPDYLESFQAKYDGILADIEKRKKAKLAATDDDYFLPILHVDDKVEKFQSFERSTKPKTRGEGSNELDDKLHHCKLEETTTSEPRPSIKVNKKTLSTFRTMFPSYDEERSKTIDWDTFVLSMHNVGFSVSHGGGSVVIFQKLDEDAGGSGRIIFHKPHPVPKIDPVMLQGMGKRMNKWFGWHRDLFALREKNT